MYLSVTILMLKGWKEIGSYITRMGYIYIASHTFVIYVI